MTSVWGHRHKSSEINVDSGAWTNARTVMSYHVTVITVIIFIIVCCAPPQFP